MNHKYPIVIQIWLPLSMIKPLTNVKRSQVLRAQLLKPHKLKIIRYKHRDCQRTSICMNSTDHAQLMQLALTHSTNRQAIVLALLNAYIHDNDK